MSGATDPALAIAVPLIASFEGCVLTPYQDVGGVWTIGYGATWLLDGSAVTGGTPPLTQEQANALLGAQVQHFMTEVDAAVTVPLNPNQTAALTDFAFNLGLDALARSTLRRLLNQGDYQGAAAQFLVWDEVDGVPNADIEHRRQIEKALFLKRWAGA